jgi:hypothetical protein
MLNAFLRKTQRMWGPMCQQPPVDERPPGHMSCCKQFNHPACCCFRRYNLSHSSSSSSSRGRSRTSCRSSVWPHHLQLSPAAPAAHLLLSANNPAQKQLAAAAAPAMHQVKAQPNQTVQVGQQHRAQWGNCKGSSSLCSSWTRQQQQQAVARSAQQLRPASSCKVWGLVKYLSW